MVLLVMLFCLFVVTPSFCIIYIKPDSVGFTVGGHKMSTMLECLSDVDDSLIEWKFKHVNSSKYEVVFKNNTIEDKFNLTYGIGENSTDLIIKNVSREEAGEYLCKEDYKFGDSGCAEVVVFEESYVCNVTNITMDYQAEICCRQTYYGNVAPLMKFRKDLEPITGVINKSKKYTSQYCIVANITEERTLYSAYGYLPKNLTCVTEWKYPMYSFWWSTILVRESHSTVIPTYAPKTESVLVGVVTILSIVIALLVSGLIFIIWKNRRNADISEYTPIIST